MDIAERRKELSVVSIRMEVWGEYAAFNRPEMKVERVMGVYGPWSAVLCLVRQRQMILACLDLMNSKMR